MIDLREDSRSHCGHGPDYPENMATTTSSSTLLKTSPSRGVTTLRTIRRYVGRVVEQFQPERVILFGSHASGSPTEESAEDWLLTEIITQGKVLPHCVGRKRSRQSFDHCLACHR